MIVKIPNFEKDLVTSTEYIRVLEVADKSLFANIVQSIHAHCEGQNTKEYIVLLSEDGKNQLDFSKNAFFVRDILGLNLEDRKITTKFYTLIKSEFNLDLDNKQQFEIYIRDIFNLLDSVLMGSPVEVNYNLDVEVDEVLKLFKVKIINEELSFIEKILGLIDLISLLDLSELTIFCNIKSFFTDSQMEEIYKHILNNNLNVLLIEGTLVPGLLKNEKKVVIDEEFNEYELS